MYNPQLETFLRTADAGSFNKAAEESYITPTAVIKQINLPEDSLGVKLFERSHRDQVMIIRTTLSKWVMCTDLSFLLKMCFNGQGRVDKLALAFFLFI